MALASEAFCRASAYVEAPTAVGLRAMSVASAGHLFEVGLGQQFDHSVDRRLAWVRLGTGGFQRARRETMHRKSLEWLSPGPSCYVQAAFRILLRTDSPFLEHFDLLFLVQLSCSVL